MFLTPPFTPLVPASPCWKCLMATFSAIPCQAKGVGEAEAAVARTFRVSGGGERAAPDHRVESSRAQPRAFFHRMATESRQMLEVSPPDPANQMRVTPRPAETRTWTGLTESLQAAIEIGNRRHSGAVFVLFQLCLQAM